MAAVMRSLLSMTLVAALLFGVAVGADITVGRPNGGWDLSTDLAPWTSSQTFTVGDKLLFRYDSSHDVLEVNKAGYDSCSAVNPISRNTGGSNDFQLKAPGTRYFICGIPGHCAAGMKVLINVISGAGSPPTAPSSPPSSPSPSATTPIVPTTTPSMPSTPIAPSPMGPMAAPPPTSAAQSRRLNGYFQFVLGAAVFVVACVII